MPILKKRVLASGKRNHGKGYGDVPFNYLIQPLLVTTAGFFHLNPGDPFWYPKQVKIDENCLFSLAFVCLGMVTLNYVFSWE